MVKGDLERVDTRLNVRNLCLPLTVGYQRLLAGGFTEWRSPVGGLVSRPAELSLEVLKRFPSRTQVTQHNCEQGWPAIAEWTGVQLARVLQEVGTLPQARYVVLYTIDGWWDSLNMLDTLHPQTLLAYGMNGRDLPVPYGTPVRLRAERQLGYKNLKYISRIDVTDRLDVLNTLCQKSEDPAASANLHRRGEWRRHRSL